MYVSRMWVAAICECQLQAPLTMANLTSVKIKGRKWANAHFKKTMQHFALLPKLIRKMPLF